MILVRTAGAAAGDAGTDPAAGLVEEVVGVVWGGGEGLQGLQESAKVLAGCGCIPRAAPNLPVRKLRCGNVLSVAVAAPAGHGLRLANVDAW
jgi:hypothetical protein